MGVKVTQFSSQCILTPCWRKTPRNGTAGWRICICKIFTATARFQIKEAKSVTSTAVSDGGCCFVSSLARDVSFFYIFTIPMSGCLMKSQCSLICNFLMDALSYLSAFHQPHDFSPSWVIWSHSSRVISVLEPPSICPFAQSGISIMRVSKCSLL